MGELVTRVERAFDELPPQINSGFLVSVIRPRTCSRIIVAFSRSPIRWCDMVGDRSTLALAVGVVETPSYVVS